MKCKFCGTEVDEKQRFCPNCGLLLDVSFTPFSVSDLQLPFILRRACLPQRMKRNEKKMQF